MASNLNGWNPKDEKYKFKKDAKGNNYLVCHFDTVMQLAFKFTQGDWGNVECDKEGNDVDNHYIQTDTAGSLVYSIPCWRNALTGRAHTASKQVRIIDTAFFIPQLNKTRGVWIYLPEKYSSAHKRYPVIYMQDGQNVFDAATAGVGEWGVDEFLDSIPKEQQAIVVAIDHGGDSRLSEYNPYDFIYQPDKEKEGKLFKAQGDDYTDFLIKTLKPYIDKHYRTLKDKENTIIVGSSMGGLIAYYAMLKYPNMIGKAGIFSPAFWTAPPIDALTDSTCKKMTGKLFFYMGALEGDSDVSKMKNIVEKLGKNSTSMVYMSIDETGKHSEYYWRKWFPEFYKFIMADGFNTKPGKE